MAAEDAFFYKWIIIGVILGLKVIAILIYWFWYRPKEKERQRLRRERGEEFFRQQQNLQQQTQGSATVGQAPPYYQPEGYSNPLYPVQKYIKPDSDVGSSFQNNPSTFVHMDYQPETSKK